MHSQQRRRLIKAEATTNPHYGKKPVHRSMEEHINNGVVIVDKPAGPTSHQVTAWARDIFHLDKAGHGGTLDPDVTGVLPVALANATKTIGLLHEAGKEYIAVMRLHGDKNKGEIRDACQEHIGMATQMPPEQSAVKREEREREIYDIDVLETKERDVLFRVSCEGGTYIRVLCEDIGTTLGCGAHMHELRRTRSGRFTEQEAYTLHDILDAYVFWQENDSEEIKNIIRPLEDVLPHIPAVVIRDSAIDAVCHGADLAVTGILQVDTGITPGDQVAVLSLKGEGVAIGLATMSTRDIMEQDQGIAVDTKRVIMHKGTYPSMWKK